MLAVNQEKVTSGTKWERRSDRVETPVCPKARTVEKKN
jgi:rubredoxin